MTSVYAHSRPGESEQTWEPLVEHLHRVADRAALFASAFQSERWGYLAGLWHDLGKYRGEFQRRLRGSREQVEHAGLGAALAVSKGSAALPLAFAIAGHHAGLANLQTQGETSQQPLVTRLRDNAAALAALTSALPRDIADRDIPSLPPFIQPTHEGVCDNEALTRRLELWTRFLFSALVDADRLATEAFYDPTRRPRPAFQTIPQLRDRLDSHTEGFRADTTVNRLRAEVRGYCVAAAKESPGAFSLTAPTGSGKTLSAMAFALHHAERHGHRRVIVVIPYTSIIEQNALVYREVFGDRDVIEHHSGLDEARLLETNREAELRRQLAAENWDAPIIVTTTVQFFESLFSNRPSVCRKLHNVAGSVIILDEAQSLPAGYLHCILDALCELTTTYGCTVVISTATQPALGRRDALPTGLEGVREIVPDPEQLSRALNRVTIQWPPEEEPPPPFEALAARLMHHEQVLAVVHSRKDARELARLLNESGRYHLSALMCPAHRSATLRKIKAQKSGGSPCRVVSTQLIEAGVDIDFPVVYRALAGLDSLAQAAGRCNREGALDRGNFVVFRAPTRPPAGVLRLGLESTEALLEEHGGALDLSQGAFFEEYFRILYGKCETDRKGVQTAREQLNFATVAQLVQLIEDGYHVPVVVPWGDSTDRVRAFAQWPTRETRRALQPYIVQATDFELNRLTALGAVECLHDSLHVLEATFRELYDPTFGLMTDVPANPNPAALIA